MAPQDSREIKPNDRINRFTPVGDKAKTRNASYRLGMVNGVYMGWARSHKESRAHHYRCGNAKKLTPDQLKDLERQMKIRQADEEKRRKEAQEKIAARMRDYYESMPTAKPDHPYLIKKKITRGNLRQDGGRLLVPLYSVGFGLTRKLWNIQTIDETGFKLFSQGARIKGCYHSIGRPIPLKIHPFVLCEGYATGYTLYRALGWPVICAMNAGNLLPVARAMRWRYKFAPFLFAADNDRWTIKQDGTPQNPGIEYAEIAASATGGRVYTLPERLGQQPSRPTDFNDMAILEGIDAVREVFRGAMDGAAG